MILTAEQVNSYKQNGALVVRDIFKPWINVLREGVEKVLKIQDLTLEKILIKMRMAVFLKTIVIGIEFQNF